MNFTTGRRVGENLIGRDWTSNPKLDGFPGSCPKSLARSNAPRLQTEKSFFILNLESVQLCPSPVLPHAISAQNCAEFEVKHKSKSSWTHSNPGTWKLVLILKWKTDWLVANISPTRTQLKSGTVCTVLLGTQFYAFQIQNEKRGKHLQA